MVTELQIDPAERAEVLAEWDRLIAEPRPAPRQPYGCATFLISTCLFLVVQQMSSLPSWLRLALLIILGLAIAGGLFFQLALASSKYHHDSARARESIEWLAANPATSDAAARRRHAVTMLRYSVTADDGPTTSGTFDPAHARERLGAHLPFVIAVERALIAEQKIYPVFTYTTENPAP